MKKVLSVELDEQVFEKIKKIAKSKGMFMYFLIQQILINYIKENEEQ